MESSLVWNTELGDALVMLAFIFVAFTVTYFVGKRKNK